MKKIFSKRYVKVIFIILVLCLFVSSDVSAKLTQYSNATNNSVINTITKVVAEIGKVGMNVGTVGLAVLLTGLSFILFILLQTVFIVSGTTDNLLQIPFPDTVIFNKMPLFDANFVNPDASSPIYALRVTISSIYDSFIVIAVALFTIMAMIIGIKLSLASLASEKAKYKQAIGSWMAGIIMLVSLKWILAGMFKINETIVQKVYDISVGVNWSFEVFSLASIPLVGSTISTIMSWFGANASAVSWGAVPGYLGLVLKYLLEGLGGNFVGSLVAFVVMGQTVSIIVVYLKRVFYCLLLGIIGPLVIAVDTFNRSVGKNSQILTNWFKQIGLTIFMQSFHAIFLLILVRMMVSIGKTLTNQYLSSLIIIILTAGLIKFEKIFKQLFGIGESIAGDLKGGAEKAFAKIGAGVAAGKALADNGRKLKDAKSKRGELLKTRAKLEQKQSILNGTMKPTSVDNNSTNITNNTSSNRNGSGSVQGNDEVKTILRDIRNQMQQQQRENNEKELRSVEKELGKVQGDISSAALAKKMGVANALAGAAFGLGANNSAVGSILTVGLDYASEKVGRKGADYSRSRMYDEAKEKGRDNPEILREKVTTNINQQITNTISLKDLRDIKTIMSGKYDSSTKANRDFSDYSYKKPIKDIGDTY